MEAHENRCSQNPLNIRACFNCSHCERVEIKYEPQIQTYEEAEVLVKSSAFKCNAKNKFMFPPKFEYSDKGVPEYVEYKGEEISQEKMPLECDLRKEYTLEDYFNIGF